MSPSFCVFSSLVAFCLVLCHGASKLTESPSLLWVKSPKLPQPGAYRNYWHPNIPLCQRRCQLAWTDQNSHLTWQSLNRNLGQACRYVHPPAFFFLCRLPYSSHCKSSLHNRNNWKWRCKSMKPKWNLNECAYLEAQLNLTWRLRWRRVRAQHRGTSEVVDRTREGKPWKTMEKSTDINRKTMVSTQALASEWCTLQSHTSAVAGVWVFLSCDTCRY